jgi:hypothetical protein
MPSSSLISRIKSAFSSWELVGEGVTSKSIKESVVPNKENNDCEIFHIDGMDPTHRTCGRFCIGSKPLVEYSSERLITTELSGI